MADKVTCTEVLDVLHLQACRELEPGAERTLEAHLEHCAACRKALAEHRLLSLALLSRLRRGKLVDNSIDA